MKSKDNEMKPKNPTIQSILEHLAKGSIRPERVDLWPAVRANLAASKTPSPHKEFMMNKRIVFSAFTAILALALVAVLMARNVTPVSAQAVLDKAYAAQTSVTSPAQGIEHMRNQIYTNIKALSEDQGTDMTIESYRDLQTGYTRMITTDNHTGRVVDVFGYDGANTYSVGNEVEAVQQALDGNQPLTVYRSPQPNIDLSNLKPVGGRNNLDAKDLFDKMRQDPNAQLIGQETWDDGRTVYVLRSEQPIKVLVSDKQVDRPMGTVLVYFDTHTYEMLGSRVSMQKDGKELVIGLQKILVDEILPAGTAVTWDLSDLQGITIVDDPNREHGDLLPEVISVSDLAAKTSNAYLLKDVPAGYTLELTAPPRQPANEPYIYIASYHTAANDYFVIQAGAAPAKVADQTDETYTTASGLVLHFMPDFNDPNSGGLYTSAVVEAPGGVAFMINSTLPRETVKAWAEELALVK